MPLFDKILLIVRHTHSEYENNTFTKFIGKQIIQFFIHQNNKIAQGFQWNHIFIFLIYNLDLSQSYKFDSQLLFIPMQLKVNVIKAILTHDTEIGSKMVSHHLKPGSFCRFKVGNSVEKKQRPVISWWSATVWLLGNFCCPAPTRTSSCDRIWWRYHDWWLDRWGYHRFKTYFFATIYWKK